MQQLVINFLHLCLSYLNVLHQEEPSVHFRFIIYPGCLIIGHNWSHHYYFHYGSNNPEDITCFNFDKFVTLP